MRRGGRRSIMVLAGVLAAWIVPGPSAFARGGHGGVGHGGGHGGFGGVGHWGGGHHFGGYPFRGFGYGSSIDPGYPGFMSSAAPWEVWTPWSWMTTTGYTGPVGGSGYGTAYGFPLGAFGYGSPYPYPYPDWPAGVIRRPLRHHGLRTVGVAAGGGANMPARAAGGGEHRVGARPF
jgi:hypothetical protein